MRRFMRKTIRCLLFDAGEQVNDTAATIDT
jgi:hypothetical protein